MKVEQPAPGARQRYQDKLELMRIAQRMTAYGWRFDSEAARRHVAECDTRLRELREGFLQATRLPAEALGASGLGTTDVVRKHFFDTLKAPAVSFAKRKTEPQFNKASLIEWASTSQAEYSKPAALLLALRVNARCKQYAQTYLYFAGVQGGRVHIGWNPVGTQTGRWTSSTQLREVLRDADGTVLGRTTHSLNGQQIPARAFEFDLGDGRGKRPLSASLRDCFIADDGCVLLKADYDQLELRLIAYVYGVRRLITALAAGEDIHMLTASVLFKELGIEASTRKGTSPLADKARNAAKGASYAFSYQMTMPGRSGRYPQLFKALKNTFPSITERQVEELARRFFALYPEIQKGQGAARQQIDSRGYSALSINGRRLYYPATMRGYNQALNFPMQGMGGALCDRAVLELAPELDWQPGSQAILGQVHDEVIVQCKKGDAGTVAHALEAAMSREAKIGAVTAGIPALADVGSNWGACVPWERFEW